MSMFCRVIVMITFVLAVLLAWTLERDLNTAHYYQKHQAIVGLNAL